MPSSILNSDDGVISGTSGIKVVGGDDGNLVFQSKGTETARINTDSQIVAAAGTASLPVLTTTGDVNTGIYFPAADTIGFVEGGAERMRITSAGEVLVGGTTEIASTTGLTVQRTNSPPIFSIYRNDTTVNSGDHLGQILFYGNDTTSNTPTNLAYIRATASGTHAAGDNPTDIVFGTTPDGSETVAEVARFTESKYLRFASGSGGIQFGGDTAAANALDDYEEGTYTATLTPGTSGTITLGNSTLAYTKIGRVVTVTGYLLVSSVASPVGAIEMNLPFTILNNVTAQTGALFIGNDLASGNVLNYWAYTSTGANRIEVFLGGGTTVSLTSAQTVKANTDFRVFVSYIAA
jgi:hypothetical protein